MELNHEQDNIEFFLNHKTEIKVVIDQLMR